MPFVGDLIGKSLDAPTIFSSTIEINGCMISRVKTIEDVETGDVLMMSSTDRQVKKTDSSDTEGVVGVACGNGASGSTIRMAVGGEFQIKVIGAVSVGDFLAASSTDGVAYDAGTNVGAFAIATSTDSDTGVKLVWARFKKAEVY